MKAGLREFVLHWKKAAVALQRAQDDQLRGTDSVVDLEALSTLFNESVLQNPPDNTSGLLHWQECMRRWHEQQTSR